MKSACEWLHLYRYIYTLIWYSSFQQCCYSDTVVLLVNKCWQIYHPIYRIYITLLALKLDFVFWITLNGQLVCQIQVFYYYYTKIIEPAKNAVGITLVWNHKLDRCILPTSEVLESCSKDQYIEMQKFAKNKNNIQMIKNAQTGKRSTKL